MKQRRIKPQCCPKAPHRKLPRDVHEDARDVARALYDTPAFDQSRRERKRMTALAAEALDRLEFETAPSSFACAYAGATTRVPTGRVIAVKGRISRKIGYDGKFVTFERA